jgi:ferredoxin-NADP reductase
MKRYVVKSVDKLTANSVCVTLDRISSGTLEFNPGQYVTLGFKRFGRLSPVRCFSIVSSPKNGKTLQLAMRVNGKYTSTLAQLQPGTEAIIQGPFGEFIVDSAYDNRIVMLAGGIGITPFISMIRHASETNSPIPISLLYSVQTQNDVPFLDELILHSKRNPRFNFAVFVTDGILDKLNGINAYKGRIVESHISQAVSNKFNKYTFFICGPAAFGAAMVEFLENNNTEQDRIVTEAFSQGSAKRKNGEVKKLQNNVYYLSAVSFFLAAGFVTVLDLHNTLERLVSAQSPATTQTNTITNSSNTNSTTSNSTTPTTTVTQTPSSNYNSNYQVPVTSVS